MTDFFAAIADTISRDGFAFVQAPEMHGALEAAGLRDMAPRRLCPIGEMDRKIGGE